MKVREFIDLLEREYGLDDELYFTIAALESEFVFDDVTVYPKYTDADDTDVFLSFNQEHRSEFEAAIQEETLMSLREDVIAVLDKYY